MTEQLDLSNNSPLNQQARHWLDQAKAESSDQVSYLAQLADWGLERTAVPLPKPNSPRQPDRHDLTSAIEAISGAEPEAATEWFLSNPNTSPEDEEANLLQLLQDSQTPQEAAQAVLETTFDMMSASSTLL